MPWYRNNGQVWEASQDDAYLWPGAELVPTYTSFQGQQYQWDPALVGREGWQAPDTTMYLGSNLLQLLDQQAAGQPMSLADQSKLEEVMRGSKVPTRDWRTLLSPSASTDEAGQRARYPAITDPDYLPLLQQVHAAADQGDPQARALLPELRKFQDLATYNSTIKQDAFSPFGDNLFGALGILGLGASAGAAAPLFAGGAGLGGTLAGIGGLAGSTGQLASMFGEGLQVPGLSKAGSILGSLGSLAGGAGGLTNVLSSGVNSLADVAKLASSAGKITGAVGRLADTDPLKQAGKYLSLAGTLGKLGSNVTLEDIRRFLG